MPRIKKDKKEKDIQISIDNNKFIKLESNIKEVKNIIHIADIHIKNDQSNRDEYNFVFNNLYESIKNLDNLKSTIIVLCGDIFDNKTNLKPESIDLLKDFFYNLGNITDVVTILGNHDQNSNNSKSLDAISPIINKGLNTKFRVLLLKNSGIYEYSNLLFGVTDIHSESVTKMDFETDKIKINLYHGYIHGAKLQNDMCHMVGKFNQTDFVSGDYTLLGDIHKFQYLNKNKTMAYPGSLLQMNYGEDLYNHGYILWNLQKKNSEFIKINNNYAYYTIEIDSGKLKNEIDKNLPKNIRLRVFYNDTNYEKREEIINKIREKYNLIQVDEIKQIKGLTVDFNDSNKKMQEISSINSVNELIIKYIKDNDTETKISKERIKEISEELDSITKKINYNFEKTKKKIKILKLSFNNMFIYGENNSIDFRNLNKIIGLVAENKKGKTSLIDCILFSIWSESDRTISNIDIIKHGTKKMTSEVILSINDIIYKITRQSNQSKGRLYNDVILAELDKETFEEKNVTESDKKKTEEKILELFGNPEDFTLLSIITQDNPINFLTMKDTEKKALLNRMFNLEIIKDVNKEVNREHLALTKMNKEYESINKENDISLTITNIEKLNKDKMELNNLFVSKCEEKEKIKKQITVYDYKLEDYTSRVEEIDNIDELKSKHIKINDDIIKNISKLDSFKSKAIDLNNEINKKKQEIELLVDIEEKYKTWKTERKNKMKELNKEFEELNNNKNPIIKLTNLDIKRKKELDKKLLDLSEIKGEKENEFEEYESYEFIEKYENEIHNSESLENEISIVNDKIENYDKSIKKLKEHKYNKDCVACMSNSITKQKLFFEEELSKFREELNNKNNEFENCNNFINKKKNKAKYDNLKKSLEIKKEIEEINIEIDELSKELKNFNKIEKEFLKNSQHNEKINIDIEKNRKEYNDIENNKYNDYDEYLQLKEQINLNNEKLNELNEKINNLTNHLSKLNKNKEEIESIINKYESNKKIYEELDTIRESLDIFKEKEKIIDKECREYMNKISQINKELTKYETNIQIVQKNKELITKNNKKKEILSIIKSATDNGGILDDILKGTILPSVESIVNNILSDVDTYKIKINYDSFIKITKIENNTEQESSGLMASGHEKSVLNIIFRLALSKLNSMISTNFFIIDEAFKNSDSNKKQKLKTLFEYLRNNYDWILVVTHDDYIKDNFDKEINIEHSNGTSLIKYY